MSLSKTKNYLELLEIRRVAQERNVLIIGGVFIVSFILLIALGMLDRLSGRSLLIVIAIIVPFGFSFFATWVRLEIINGSIELINNLPIE